jgi:oxygen-independent coproporphyrinogen-3 oxidase
MQSHSIYLHIPFCHHLCSYCDFNTYAGLNDLIPAYINALCKEIQFVANYCDQKLPVHTIFIGGGTPSVLPLDELEKILQAIDNYFKIRRGIEITMEANPGRLNFEYLKSLHDLGINRLSLGMQSAIPEELQLLERQHDFVRTAEAVHAARKAGFENINLDLIFGIPDQTLTSWQISLDLALSLKPDHFSFYSLSIEPGTPLNNWLARGFISEPDSDISAEMYELASSMMESRGYQQYEISNWALQDDALIVLTCQHNLQYWRNFPYLGLGAGAHGFSSGKRTANVRRPESYISKLRSWEKGEFQDTETFPITPAIAKITEIDRQEEIKETMMMGLRLTDEGISRQEFQSRFGIPLDDVYGGEIDELIGLGLLEWGQETTGILRLTPGGRLLGNQVFRRFI